jgi:RNA polymerase sigma factor (sigma-70 family)
LENIPSLSLSSLRHRCAEESARFFRRQEHDPRYCYELFRRAAAGRDEHAWELIYVQYSGLVSGWVERHPLFQAAEEDTEFFVNRAFEKMWAALTPEKFEKFQDFRGLMRYFQMCVHSAVIDHLRQKQETIRLEETQEAVVPSDAPEAHVERSVLSRDHRRQFWQAVDSRLQNEKEKQLVYGMFVLDLKPRELADEFRGVFRDIQEIYRIKENVMDRLRRDQELQRILGVD